MAAPKILAFAGSVKKTSVNKQILAVAADGAREAGATVEVIDLLNYPMPLMNEDLEAEEGAPEAVIALKAKMADAEGLLLACPEYNGSITPLLKNVIDWVSRSDDGGSGLRYYKGKTVGLIAASGGSLGGMRGLVHVRAILSGLGMIVIPEQAAVPGVHKVFDETGAIVDEGAEKRLVSVGKALAQTTAKLIA